MKKTMLILGPVSSRSGYGDHARDVCLSFLDLNQFDIKIVDCPWGNTPRTALNDTKNSNIKRMADILHKSNEQPFPQQPDIYVDIRIPNEFQQMGKYNIGVTAGIETNAVSQQWLEGCNKMDLIIVPSEHSKNGFLHSTYDMTNSKTKESLGQLKLVKPMDVLFEGIREDVYKPIHHKEIDREFFDWLNEEVPEKFAYLHVGLWGKGGYGEDRKDIGKLIKVFCETFANEKKQPALILKTNGAGFSILDRESTKARIQEVKNMFPKDIKLPNVYLLHGDLEEKELNYLYNHPKIKAMVSFTHGEGFGRPLLEATLTGLPLITTAWSGQLDFTDKHLNILIGGEMAQVPKSAVWENIIIEQSQWFNIDENMARNALQHMYQNHSHWKSKAKTIMERNRREFTLDKMTEKLKFILDKHMTGSPKLSTSKELNLPKLIKRS
tara:strand:- start:734 stop:2047 length:1314 start_codon:yes stop_codon:yes gene_type:complete